MELLAILATGSRNKKKLMNNKSFFIILIGCIVCSFIFLRPSKVYANAPTIVVKVIDQETNEPINGIYVRWTNKGGGSYKEKYKEDQPETHPRRYKKTEYSTERGEDGIAIFPPFQETYPQEQITELDDLNDFEYKKDSEGNALPKKQLNPQGAPFGCGQSDHSMIAISPANAEKEYTCKKTGFDMKKCGNSSCEVNVTVTCKTRKKQKTKEIDGPNKNDLHLGANSANGQNPSEMGATNNPMEFACIQSHGCQHPSDSDISDPNNEKDERYKLCTPEAQDEQVAPYTARLPELQELVRKAAGKNQDVWILQCFNEPDPSENIEENSSEEQETTFAAPGYRVICTTGSKEGDLKAHEEGVLPLISYEENNVSHFTYLKEEYGLTTDIYKKNESSERVKINTSETPQPFQYESISNELEWETHFEDGPNFDYTFILAYTENDQRTNDGGQYSQDQTTLTTDSACSLIQDPYGTVFDSKTLEPLSGVAITILKYNGSTYVPVTPHDAPGVTQNPILTQEDGTYAFFVPDGQYKLKISKEGYTFFGDISSLHPSYASRYQNIYQGEVIIQKGNAQHRDIPLDTDSSFLEQLFQKMKKILK